MPPTSGRCWREAEDSDALGRSLARGESIDLGVIEEAAADNQIIELLDLVLRIGIQEQASDIHFEPFEDQLRIRQRIDGVLYEMAPVRKHLAMAIISRIKVMADLDIAERRLPQDGRIEMMGRDLRVSILPTMFGESGGAAYPRPRGGESRAREHRPSGRGPFETLSRSSASPTES